MISEKHDLENSFTTADVDIVSYKTNWKLFVFYKYLFIVSEFSFIFLNLINVNKNIEILIDK